MKNNIVERLRNWLEKKNPLFEKARFSPQTPPSPKSIKFRYKSYAGGLMKRMFSTLCISLILFTTGITGCSSSEKTDDIPTEDNETINSGTTSSSPLELLPDENLNGFNFRLLAADNKVQQYTSEGITAEKINDSIYATYSWVSEKYNINFTIDSRSDADNSYQSLVTKNHNAGDDAYEIYAMFLSSAASTYAVQGYFKDWNGIDYVKDNLTKEWWNQNIQKSMRINNYNYFLNGDLGYWTIGNIHAMAFNKKIFDDREIEYPYNEVKDGTWTLDRFMSLVKDANSDLNGDGEIKKSDDFYGFMSSEWIAPISFPIASGLEPLVYDETGYPTLNFYNEKAVDVYSRMVDLFITAKMPITDDAIKYFKEGRVLIVSTHLNTISSDLRLNMSDDFGILPEPKYDEKQKNYISTVDAGIDSLVVPDTNNHIRETGLIIEALCEKAAEEITPAFYENSLQRKSVRDIESEEMLDIIREGAVFDALYNYNFGGLGFAMKDWIKSGVKDITSKYESMENRAVEAIKKMWESVEKSSS